MAVEIIGGDSVSEYKQKSFKDFYKAIPNGLWEDLRDAFRNKVFVLTLALGVALTSLPIYVANRIYRFPEVKKINDICRMGVAHALDITGNTDYKGASSSSTEASDLASFNQVVTLPDGKKVHNSLKTIPEEMEMSESGLEDKTFVINNREVIVMVPDDYAGQRSIKSPVDTDGNGLADHEMTVEIIN